MTGSRVSPAHGLRIIILRYFLTDLHQLWLDPKIFSLPACLQDRDVVLSRDVVQSRS